MKTIKDIEKEIDLDIHQAREKAEKDELFSIGWELCNLKQKIEALKR